MKFNKKSMMRIGILILSIFILLNPINRVFAENLKFSKDQIALKFNFPDDKELIEIPGGENAATYNDYDFSTVFVSSADLYYEINPNEDEKISQKYPKDEIWLECGFFENTWNNEAYVLDYLKSDFNSGTNTYQCAIEKISIAGMPFYRFTFKSDENNNKEPGGIIYLTLYRSHLYIVQFFNFYSYESVKSYAESFESTLTVDGIDGYAFEEFNQNDTDNVFVIIAACGAFLAAAAGFAIYKFRKGAKRGN